MTSYEPNLEAFNNRSDLVFVIDRFNHIEHLLNKIIVHYIDPQVEKKRFVSTILLNTAIVSFASKLKLFFHINAVEKWVSPVDQNKYHKLMKIRNQFAHTGKNVINLISDSSNDESNINICLMLESVKGKGELEEVDSEEALDQFTNTYVEIREQLHNVLKIIEYKG